jgi:aspartate aminotransferase-like enzyme
MLKKSLLMIPGPTPVPPEVLQALATPMINHRGPEYAALQREVVENCKYVFQTQHDVIIFPSAGTGGMEAAIVNILSPGDQVLSVSIGVFGDRWAKIARAFGAEVIECNFEWGRAADPDVVDQALKEHPNVKAVLVTHNETSTGVTNDLKSLAEVVRSHGPLLMVDAISSLMVTDLQMDAWGCDVVVAGSQKAFMIPPGLSFVAVGPRAWEAHASAKMPRFYWDFSSMKRYMERDQTPYTPALTLLYGLRVALRAVKEAGLEASFARHAKLGAATRAGIKALGLELFADEAYASNSVTAVKVPEGISVKELRKRLREKYGVTTGGGQQKLEETIFRIGHLGYITEPDIVATFAALEQVLLEMGWPVKPGSGVAEAARVLSSEEAPVA